MNDGVNVADLVAGVLVSADEVAGMGRAELVGVRPLLWLDGERVSVYTRHMSENGHTLAEHHGTVRTLTLPAGVLPGAVADWMRENAGDLARVLAGMGEEWDGSNMRGTLTPDARAALDGLQDEGGDLVGAGWSWEGRTLVSEMDASDYLDPIHADICRAASADEAAALAVSALGPDGVDGGGDGLVYVDRDAAETLARDWWTEAQPEPEDRDAAPNGATLEQFAAFVADLQAAGRGARGAFTLIEPEGLDLDGVTLDLLCLDDRGAELHGYYSTLTYDADAAVMTADHVLGDFWVASIAAAWAEVDAATAQQE